MGVQWCRPRKRYSPSACHLADKNEAGRSFEDRNAAAVAESRLATLAVIETTVRAASGEMNAASSFSRGGSCARVVGAPASLSRVVFCPFGPALVDVGALWISPSVHVLCSGRDHTENVALASATRRGTSCRHSSCFLDALGRLESVRANTFDALQIKVEGEPHAFSL